MPTIAQNGDIWELRAEGVCFSQQIILTHHYQLSGVDAGTEDDDVAEALLAQMTSFNAGAATIETPYLNLLPPQYELVRWTAQLVSPVRRSYYEYLLGVVGANAAGTETANQSVAITLAGDTAGRSEVSNRLIGPIPQHADVQQEGYVDNAYKVLLELLVLGLFDKVVNVAPNFTMTPVIYHRNNPVQPSASEIVRSRIGQTIRVHRRRTVGLGS